MRRGRFPNAGGFGTPVLIWQGGGLYTSHLPFNLDLNMKTQNRKPDQNFTVMVQEAVFHGNDNDTRPGKDCKGDEIRLYVLRTDGFSTAMWFPLRHIHRRANNKMTCPMWLVERKNKYLRAMKLMFAKVQLEPFHDQ